ncbi:uncharacterized protein LOC124117991 [Haliotis rufescens]|uniref:uncharacterized protein LOC124117991 n=1 Tax=Haliotis rufescens TaxID=6454 RepID=UPI00201F63ED|nr:uncharacterized protein LOC124117991 [Haliotis rufescens]
MSSGFHKTTYKRSSQLTTLANLTTIKITPAPRNDNQAFSDADNDAEVSENPLYVTYQVEPVDNKVHFNDNAPEHILALGGAVDVGDLNDVRDKTPKHQSAVGGAINVDDLYAVPDKTPKHQLAVGGAVNDGDKYAVPDKTPKHQPAEGGAVNIGDLYAVPDMPMKTKNGTYSTWSEADNEYSEI